MTRASLATLGLVLAVTVHPAQAETIDRIVAVVAGQVIMLSDVTAARDLGLQSADGASDPVRSVLSKLIDRELMIVEVDRYAPPEPDAASIDRQLASVRARFASAGELQAVLARDGIDEKHLRETIRQDLRISAYLDQRFAPADPRRATLVAEWLSGLRRRGDVVDLYASR
jgi:hypothetical protein